MTGINMPSNYHYTNGLTFASSNITCDPGTYLMAMQYLPDGASQSWQLTGSTNYQNPVKVIVQQAPYGADSWEPNNTVAQASNLPITSRETVQTVNTSDANISNNSTTSADYDYYKIDLDSGNSYSIGARLNDSKNSGNGQNILRMRFFIFY